MGKGFVSFILAAVFLLAIVPAAAMVSSQQPDLSFESHRSMLVQEIAVKQALYQSSGAVAAASQLEAEAAEAVTGGRMRDDQYVEGKLLLNLQELEGSLGSGDFEVEFWCGAPFEHQRMKASGLMLELGGPVVPDGAHPMPDCIPFEFVEGIPLISGPNGFIADTGNRTVHFANMGFSIYSRKLGAGKAAVIPGDYAVDYK